MVTSPLSTTPLFSTLSTMSRREASSTPRTSSASVTAVAPDALRVRAIRLLPPAPGRRLLRRRGGGRPGGGGTLGRGGSCSGGRSLGGGGLDEVVRRPRPCQRHHDAGGVERS